MILYLQSDPIPASRIGRAVVQVGGEKRRGIVP